MVVVQIEPNFRPMDRSGIASGTRAVAMKIWKGKLPNRPREELVRELYAAENKGKAEPSGSQDMIGLVYPGMNRLDYDFKIHGGVFPAHIESCNNARVARWLENVLHLDSGRTAAGRLQSARREKSGAEMGRAASASRAKIVSTRLSKWTRRRSAHRSI